MQHIRFITLAFALCLTCISVEAQQVNSDRRHNIRIGVSTPSLISGYFAFIDDSSNDTMLESTSDLLAEERYYKGDTKYLSGVHAEYSYNFKPWVSLGAKATFAMTSTAYRHVYTNEVYRRDNRYSMGIVASVRFDYLRKSVVHLYSSVGLGIGALIEPDDSTVAPIYDITLFGITLGKKVYFFGEVGTGISGIIRLGVGCNF